MQTAPSFPIHVITPWQYIMVLIIIFLFVKLMILNWKYCYDGAEGYSTVPGAMVLVFICFFSIRETILCSSHPDYIEYKNAYEKYEDYQKAKLHVISKMKHEEKLKIEKLINDRLKF